MDISAPQCASESDRHLRIYSQQSKPHRSAANSDRFPWIAMEAVMCNHAAVIHDQTRNCSLQTSTAVVDQAMNCRRISRIRRGEDSHVSNAETSVHSRVADQVDVLSWRRSEAMAAMMHVKGGGRRSGKGVKGRVVVSGDADDNLDMTDEARVFDGLRNGAGSAVPGSFVNSVGFTSAAVCDQADNGDLIVEGIPFEPDSTALLSLPLRSSGPVAVDKQLKTDREGAGEASRDVDTGRGIGVLEFLKGKNILVTGGTGFFAKVMVEKILRVQPNVGQLYLLIQPQKNVTAGTRLSNTINSPVFKLLKATHRDDYAKFMNGKLTAVSGTISTDGLGIAQDVAEELSKKVDVIVNSAASTTLDDRYDAALNVNTQGPGRLLDFANSCTNLQLFLHVSTAYVNGERQGYTPEKPFQMGDSIARERSDDTTIPELHVATELALCTKTLQEAEAEMSQSSFSTDKRRRIVDQKMQQFGLARAKLFGWQNTYLISKAMGEMLVDSLRGDIPVVVLRPSVVESTLAEPFPGWIEGIRMLDPIVVACGKGQMTEFPGDSQEVLDLIPADLVVNALLMAMAKHAQKPGLVVYQVASGAVNPLTLDMISDAFLEHFTKDPMPDRTGQPIVVQRFRWIPSMEAYNLYTLFRHQLPLQFSKIMQWGKVWKAPSKRQLSLQEKTLEEFQHMAKIYVPYSFYSGRFGIENTESLSKQLSEEELGMFAVNIQQINWMDYLCKVHIPGLRNYVLKGRYITKKWSLD